jgi:hypothetical protein
MTVPIPNFDDNASSNSGDRKEAIITLYSGGKSPGAIAKYLGLTPSWVRQVIRDHKVAQIKMSGTNQMRVERLAEAEIVREQILAGLFPVDEKGEPLPPDKDALAGYVRVVRLEERLMGASAAGPIYVPGEPSRAIAEQYLFGTFQRIQGKKKEK